MKNLGRCNRVGVGLAAPVFPHHRTCALASGGSRFGIYRMRQVLHQALGIALFAMAGGPGATQAPPAQAATFVYVGNAESNDIYVLRLNRQTGELMLVESILIPGIIKS